ncbi:uncharacterized protein LOC109529281 [Hippocampus comes]|uniref:uncharacterized protein LOC109529281 n=1 Tax=Hippocampus comes TaxID=109280 RepID=UPI00094E67A5|nr:PREDICTED: uncharacterized protein LOC109529281 [Hippocampus comes]
METVLEDIVAMVKQHQGGIPIKKLSLYYSKTYRRSLSIANLGFKSNAALLACLENDLVVEGNVVFHKHYKDNIGTVDAEAAGTSASAIAAAVVCEPTKLKKEKKKVTKVRNLVTMMTEHPKGILMKHLATEYRLKFHHKLKMSTLGFSSIADLVATLDRDLVVIGDLVIHKRFPPQGPPGDGISETETPSSSDSASSSQPIPDKHLPAGPELTDELDQQQLHKRILEVAGKYQLTEPSMDLLEVCYFHHYGEKLPFQLYLSMYDTLESSSSNNLPIPSGTGTAALQQDAAASTSKKSDAARRECSSSVFREAYNAQVREVHRDNVRAMEAVVDDEVQWKKKRDLDPDAVSSLMEDVIRDLAGEGELVTKEKVISRTCILMQLTSKELERLNLRSIQALNDLHYLVKEITMYIQSTEAVTSVCTLYELGQNLAGLKNKKRFEELNLGPLCKLPVIHRMFKIDSNTKDDDIVQIETVDILKQLRNYRRKAKEPKVDLAEFMKYLADHYNCESPYELGIRIHSLGLPIATLNKVSRLEHSEMNEMKEAIRKELEEETREHLIKLKKSVLEPVKATSSVFAGNLELRRKYASLTAAEVVLAVFTNAEKVLSSGLHKHVRKFLTEVSGNKLATALFQLAICGGSLAVPQDQVANEKTPQTSEKNDPMEDRPATSIPSEAKVKQYLKDSLSSINSAIHLADIAIIEGKLTKHFQVKDFHSLGQGSFLGFLAKHIQLLQDVLGPTLILRSGGMESARSFSRPTKQDIFEFIKQCGQTTSGGQDELSHIELALRSHYGVQDSRNLGYGSLQALARLVQCQKDLGGGGPSLVFYESTLFARHPILSAESECEAVGRLGEVSKLQALASLHSCPLLEDLNEWSQWELIFKQIPKPLKKMIQWKTDLPHQFPVKLSHIELALRSHYGVQDSRNLGYGSLQALARLVQCQKDLGGGGPSLVFYESTLFARHPILSAENCCCKLKALCAINDFEVETYSSLFNVPQLSHIELALRSHYGVQDSRNLGYGSLQALARLVQCQKDLGGGGPSLVFYESTLFARHPILSAESECEAVGRLGEVSKLQALASLHSCPLLEDLSEWSQWELIFKPFHGSLKDFIERHAANTGLAALEVAPSLLLRITSDTGDTYFSNAALTLDPVGTAGHLVSIVVADGITNAPTALLANHMQSSLAAAVAEEDLSRAEEDMSCYTTVANFLLECLVRIPNRICQALLQQVFLEPLSRVLGQTKSKLVLITVAQSNPRHINCLHRLGILMGITEWLKDYQKKLTTSQIPNGASYSGPLHQPKVQTQSNVVDSESSSLSGENMSDDEGVADNNATDSGLSSSPLNHGLQQGEDLAEEESAEEELFVEMSDNCSEAQAVCSNPSELLDLNEDELATSQPEPTLDVHRAIIEEIRKKEFGIGVELTSEGQNLIQAHQYRLGRSLDRLSTELYSKDTHFVLELIQNADDNNYPSGSDVVPALAFVVERDCITILNNETGFQEANIKAICDVGQSTKGKHKYGYIGQKGIGFKSVFKVTDRPEIHSNGFHLFFDKTCGPMGYILPHWMDDDRPLDPQLNDSLLHSSWTTKICLPLRSESHQTRNLFHDVHPSLLLFLHRLRSITIYNQAENRLVTMTRKDLSHNVLEVEHTDGTERWLVVKSTLRPKMVILTHPSVMQCTDTLRR